HQDLSCPLSIPEYCRSEQPTKKVQLFLEEIQACDPMFIFNSQFVLIYFVNRKMGRDGGRHFYTFLGAGFFTLRGVSTLNIFIFFSPPGKCQVNSSPLEYPIKAEPNGAR